MSLRKYSEYKDSGVEWLGSVPAHWGISQSRRMFAVRSEPALASDRMLTASQKYGVLFQSDFVEREGRRVVEVILGTENLKHVEPNDFIISMRSFQGGIEWCKLRGSTSFHYVMLKPVKHVWPAFFAHLFKSGQYIQALRRTTDLIRDGQELRYSNFAQVDLPIVPVDEQKAIAVFLDQETRKIDVLIAEQEKLLSLLAEKRQATISHAVTRGLNRDAPMKDSGVAWLGDVPAHWGNSKKLLDLAQGHRHSFVNGPFGSDLLTSELVSNGVPVIYIRDIKLRGYLRVSEWCVTPEKAEQLNFCNVIPGDVLVAKVGDPPGLAAVYPEGEVDGIVTQDVIRLRLDPVKAKAEYIRWLLNSKYGQTQIDHISVESTRTRVGLGEYKQLRFFVPPLYEQTAISDFLEAETTKLDALKAEAERAIDLLKERRSALIAAAVTGKIDVRNAVPQELAA